MNTAFLKEWALALTSGDYKQGQGVLHDTSRDEWCCLGVACDLTREQLGLQGGSDSQRTGAGTVETFNGHGQILPLVVCDYIGITPSGELSHFCAVDGMAGGSLMSLNDSGSSFAEIAELLLLAAEGVEVFRPLSE